MSIYYYNIYQYYTLGNKKNLKSARTSFISSIDKSINSEIINNNNSKQTFFFNVFFIT